MAKKCSIDSCNGAVFSKGYCMQHWGRFVYRPKRSVRSKIAPRSEKMKAALRDYMQVRKGYLSANKLCGAGLQGCNKHATEVHHKKGRIGGLLTDTAHFLPVCGHCHRMIEDNPAMAKELGLSVSRHCKGE